jgi:hypothetical protein
MELWSAVNSCFWSCIAQSAGAREVALDGRHFRILKLVMHSSVSAHIPAGAPLFVVQTPLPTTEHSAAYLRSLQRAVTPLSTWCKSCLLRKTCTPAPASMP